VTDAAELAAVVSRWLGSAQERSRCGENGRRVVEQNRGALDRLMAVVERLI